MRPNSQPKAKAALLGVGLDNQDGHKRITKAEKFAVVGGSEETHERMTETLIKTCEDLKRRGRELEDAAPKEVAELLHKNTPR
ncbi:hypothetical protein [Cerasicoccus fimbriatus]|uniref:hypothetical protein n=1 Tax=Cerasicoccus fimbriatus TaxID=3014554 RepID=UPI0022B531EE|nr:hypothetical protein [Cerasicoccus sp. TK19100]